MKVIQENFVIIKKGLYSWSENVSFQSFYKSLISRRGLIWLGLLIGFLFFHSKLTVLIVEYILPGFEDFQRNWLSDLLILLIVMLLLISLGIRAIKFYRPSFSEISISIIAFIVHGFYRVMIEPPWVYITFIGEKSNIAYLDILFLPILYPFAVVFSLLLNPLFKEGNHKFFLEDLPIDNGNQDVLQRRSHAEDLARKVINQKFDRAFSVAIIGPWGSGKTSFNVMVEEEIKASRYDPIIVKFNAFYNHDPADILKEYFKTFSISVREFSGKLSNEVKQYRNYLARFIEEQGVKGLSNLLELTTNSSGITIQSQYEKINDTINALGKQIIVFFDDVDRLKCGEIIELLKIVRNTGDFTNTVYFVAFDKSYVENALKDHSEFENDKFLEKYFQFEFILPPISRKMVRQRFLDSISDKLEEINHRGISAIVNPDDHGILVLNQSVFDLTVRTLRDATRLANIFCFEIRPGEVDNNEFLLLMLLKMKFPNIYQKLSSNYLEYLESNTEGHFVLKREKEGIVILKDIESREYSIAEKILTEVFSDSQQYAASEPSVLSIRRRKNIERYFYLTILSGDISYVEFRNVFYGTDLALLHQSLKKWMGNGKDHLVLETIDYELRHLKDEEKENLKENFIEALCYMGRLTVHGTTRDQCIEELLLIFGLRENVYETEAVDESRIKSLKFDGSSIDFDTYLIWRIAKILKKRNQEKWIEEQITLYKSTITKMFLSYLENSSELDFKTYRFFHRAYGVCESEEEIIKEICSEFIGFLEKHLTKFLSDIIDRDIIYNTFSISDITLRLFEDHHHFRKWLKNQRPTEQIKEFLKFQEIVSYYGFKGNHFFKFEEIELRDYGNAPRKEFIKELYLRVNGHKVSSLWVNEVEKKFDILRLQILEGSILVLRDWSSRPTKEFNSDCLVFLQTYFKGDGYQYSSPPKQCFKEDDKLVWRYSKTSNEEQIVVLVVHYQEDI